MFSGIYYELTIYVQYTKNQAVYLELIVTIHFVRPHPNLLTLYVQYTKTQALKKLASI